MKKLLIAALLAVTIGTSAFAAESDKKVSQSARNSFQVDFTEASNVAWTSVGKFAKATFILDGEKMEAYYKDNGEKVGSSRSIPLDKIPAAAKRIFAKKFNGYTVKEAIRFEGAEESAYFLSAENDRETAIVKIDSFNVVSIVKSAKK